MAINTRAADTNFAASSPTTRVRSRSCSRPFDYPRHRARHAITRSRTVTSLRREAVILNPQYEIVAAPRVTAKIVGHRSPVSAVIGATDGR